jgi:hypothetical protein
VPETLSVVVMDAVAYELTPFCPMLCSDICKCCLVDPDKVLFVSDLCGSRVVQTRLVKCAVVIMVYRCGCLYLCLRIICH